MKTTTKLVLAIIADNDNVESITPVTVPEKIDWSKCPAILEHFGEAKVNS